jgi:Arc/MetJ family transcription regulator
MIHPKKVVSMARTTIDLDGRWADASQELGTHGKSETVNAALAEVLLRRERRTAAEALRDVRLDLDDEDAMAGAWR